MARILAVVALAAACGVAAPAGAQAPAPTPAPTPTLPSADDPLGGFLKALGDSSDAYFGAGTVVFDTTGIDSLAAVALAAAPAPPRLRPVATTFYPVFRYHRTEGVVLGAGVLFGSQAMGILDLRGSYGFTSKGGRYAFDYRKTLYAADGRLPRFQARRAGRIGEGTRLDLELHYGRQTVGFMPEHTDPDLGGFGALISGSNAQSVYEQRGWRAGLVAWTGDWRLTGGVQQGRERAMNVVEDFSLFGDASDVPPNTAADADEYTEPYGGVAMVRRNWQFAGTLDARGTGDRWRLRGAFGKGVNLTPRVKAIAQLEAGAVDPDAPRQRRFEIGGAVAVPSLQYGDYDGSRLLVGRLELVESTNLLKLLGLSKPDWFVPQPAAFFHYAAAWDDPAGRENLFVAPPSTAWHGAAGVGIAWRLGIPEPDVFWRIEMAWPVGPESGSPTLNFTIGRGFDLVGRL